MVSAGPASAAVAKVAVAEPPAVTVAADVAAASEKSLPRTLRWPSAVLLSVPGVAVAVTDNGKGPKGALLPTETVKVAVSPGWICSGAIDALTPAGVGDTASESDLPLAVGRSAAEEIV